MVERYGNKSYMRIGNHPGRKWTLEVMAGAVLAIKEKGEPINPKALEVNYRVLYGRIRDYPGGWDFVVREAGFDPDSEVLGTRMNKYRKLVQVGLLGSFHE